MPAKKITTPALSATFEFEKSTKGTHKFSSLDDTSPVSGGIYVQKSAFPANVDPATVTFTVSLV